MVHVQILLDGPTTAAGYVFRNDIQVSIKKQRNRQQ